MPRKTIASLEAELEEKSRRISKLATENEGLRIENEKANDTIKNLNAWGSELVKTVVCLTRAIEEFRTR